MGLEYVVSPLRRLVLLQALSNAIQNLLSLYTEITHVCLKKRVTLHLQEGCTKSAEGATTLCKRHGGGKRCTVDGCTKSAEGRTAMCKAHGGGKRCVHEGGCTKAAEGGTPFCIAHGGGKRCQMPECTKAARGRTLLCR